MSAAPARKPALPPKLTKAPAREHPVAPQPAPSTRMDELVMLSARVDPALRLAVKRHAVEHRISVQELLTEALRAYLADPPR